MANMENPSVSALSPFARQSVLETSRFYMGNLITFLVKSSETNGRYALVKGSAKVGNEPPPHYHQWENETWYVVEGLLEFFWEGQEKSVMVRAGESVFLPRGVAHGVYYRSPTLQVLLIAQADGEHAVGMDIYFEQMSEPARSMELPKDTMTYVVDDPEHAMNMGVANGIIMLSPEETAQRLPHYPGFGANLRQGDSEGKTNS